MVEFKILKGITRAHSKLSTLDFRRADFGITRDLLGRVPLCCLSGALMLDL